MNRNGRRSRVAEGQYGADTALNIRALQYRDHGDRRLGRELPQPARRSDAVRSASIKSSGVRDPEALGHDRETRSR